MNEEAGLHASVVTVSGPPEEFDKIAAMAGESLLPWIRQFDGYKGFIVMADRDNATAYFMTFWESRDALERSAHSRAQVRDQLAKTAGAEITAAGGYSILIQDGLL